MASIVKSEDLICFHIDFYSPKPLKIIMQLRLLSMRSRQFSIRNRREITSGFGVMGFYRRHLLIGISEGHQHLYPDALPCQAGFRLVFRELWPSTLRLLSSRPAARFKPRNRRRSPLNLAGLGASPGSLVLKTGSYFRPEPKHQRSGPYQPRPAALVLRTMVKRLLLIGFRVPWALPKSDMGRAFGHKTRSY